MHSQRPPSLLLPRTNMPIQLTKEQAKERGEDLVKLIDQDIRDRDTHVRKRKIVRDI